MDRDEQLRIASILDAGAAAVDDSAAVVSKLEAIRAGLLDSLCLGSVEVGADPESESDRLPPGWTVASLERLAAAPICYGIVQPGALNPAGVPVLAIHDLDGDYATGIHRSSPQIEANYLRSRVAGDDVLISVKGTVARLGVVPHDFQGNISRDLARIRPVAGLVPEFLRYALEAPTTQRRLIRATVGTTRAEISIWILKRFQIAVPPRPEQERIVGVVRGLDERLAAERQALRKRQRLHAGLVQDLIAAVQLNAQRTLVEAAAA